MEIRYEDKIEDTRTKQIIHSPARMRNKYARAVQPCVNFKIDRNTRKNMRIKCNEYEINKRNVLELVECNNIDVNEERCV